MISRDTGTPKDVLVFLLFIAKKFVLQMPFPVMTLLVKRRLERQSLFV